MEEICNAFALIAELGCTLGVGDICDLPGAWEQEIDDSWYVAVNAHKHAVTVMPEGGMEASVPPYHAAVWFNGWLAGLVSAHGGTIAAGELANESSFIDAVKARIGKERREVVT